MGKIWFYPNQRNATIKANTIKRKPFVRLRRRRKERIIGSVLKLAFVSSASPENWFIGSSVLNFRLLFAHARGDSGKRYSQRSNLTQICCCDWFTDDLCRLLLLSSASVRALTLVAQHLQIIGAFHSRRLGVTRRVALSPGVFWDVLWCEAASTLSSDHSCLKTD